MNRALLYLSLALLKRKSLELCRSLRRPTTAIGFAAVMSLILVVFHYRHEEVFGQVARGRSLIGFALLMFCASLFKGFMQRGLVFDPPDIEFLFTSPFTERQIIFYRLLPNYLYALIQGVVTAALLAPHLQHPIAMAAGLILFQIICFHVATGAAVFAGTIPAHLHHRLRWMMLGVFSLLTALYFRAAWYVKFMPDFASSPLTQLFFYPAVTLADVSAAPALHRWALRLSATGSFSLEQYWRPALYLCGLTLGAGVSLWALLRLKSNLFEASLETTMRVAERRVRLRQGREAATSTKTRARSVALPEWPFFHGVGAIVWKNLMVARRSRKEMLAAAVFSIIGAWLLGALVHTVYASAGTDTDARATMGMRAFNLGIASFIASLAFFLQRMFPFDFRRDGHHLVGFRTLPMSPIGLVLAEVSVPVALVLACQAVMLIPLLVLGRVEWPTLVLLALGYPAVALALNAVWNLYYLLSATRRAGGQKESASAVGTLMVVALSFFIFFPAAWTANRLSQITGLAHVANADLPEILAGWGGGARVGIPLAAGGGLGVQYLVDLFLIIVLARLFHRFEVSRDS